MPWRERIANAREIGVVFGQRTQLWWDLPVIESFDLLRDIYSVHQRDYLRARDELVALLDLEAILDVPVRQLSLGQRMRCDLTASLLHAPSLLYLDEPTIGLDAVSKLAVRDFVKRLNRERDVTIILTTHDMDDIEALCRRVIVIDEGQILSDGTLDALRRSVSRERWLTIDRHRRGCPARLRHVSFPGQERRFRPSPRPPPKHGAGGRLDRQRRRTAHRVNRRRRVPFLRPLYPAGDPGLLAGRVYRDGQLPHLRRCRNGPVPPDHLPALVRRVFTFIVPLATINYFPAHAILGRPDPLGSAVLFRRLAPLVGFAFLLVCLGIWQIGVRHYRSTGS